MAAKWLIDFETLDNICFPSVFNLGDIWTIPPANTYYDTAEIGVSKG
jgi:hypothetical protein